MARVLNPVIWRPANWPSIVSRPSAPNATAPFKIPPESKVSLPPEITELLTVPPDEMVMLTPLEIVMLLNRGTRADDLGAASLDFKTADKTATVDDRAAARDGYIDGGSGAGYFAIDFKRDAVPDCRALQ